MLREIQEKIGEVEELWEKIQNEFYYGHIHDKVKVYLEDVCGLGERCIEIEVNEWNDYSTTDSLEEIQGAIDNWLAEGFKFNIIAYYDDESADFYVTIPEEVYWKGPGAWLPLRNWQVWELDGENFDIEAMVMPCPMAMEQGHV